MSVWSNYQPPTSCKISKKSNDAILRKLIKYGKSVHFRPFWSIFGTIRIFLKNPALSLFSTYQPLTSCKISKNSNEPILRKLALKKLDGRKDKHEIIGPSQSVGPKKGFLSKSKNISYLVILGHFPLFRAKQKFFPKKIDSFHPTPKAQ